MKIFLQMLLPSLIINLISEDRLWKFSLKMALIVSVFQIDFGHEVIFWLFFFFWGWELFSF
jgi:hypothetical protein